MDKVIVNCSTGATEVVELTAEEIATLEQDAQQNPPVAADPTAEDYLLDLDYRLSKIELGI
jgi:hypothetical protein